MPTNGDNPTSSPSPATRRNRGIAIGALVLVAALVLGVLSAFATGGGSSGDSPPVTVETPGESSADPNADTYAQLAELARRDKDDKLAMGRADAPVVLIEYADFKCPFCGKFARDTEPELVEEYVDKGVLRIEWRNLVVFGEDSAQAAYASWAAGQQDRFWEFHEVAFSEEDNMKKGYSKERLDAIAEKAGVKDMDRFHTDMESYAAKQAVEKDQEEAYGIGATSTPSFLVNGKPIAGAQPTEVFAEAIEAAAKQAEAAEGSDK
ncbi:MULTISPECIES: DsbA family protein [Streptomyces]|uniref:DsbA family protein n=2 Tax=Streptomyces TaxID=1883 RepID=A0A3R7EJX5_9ACTN|nr:MULTISPECIES: DsbA family protein [Streptomyces]KNE82958.1 DSBA oxidoreductase [Streptomyces fradiae]OFA52910.1 disulfide bond formation protein DsbA [Streptomyces fradiae]PQM20367.1 disulfide bond formation protein DsbA [Streptomyces xinghaiensis]RKM91176.1 DsbA family protein [Streptomyces xinghaiensis]RNC69669.1 DsbA family protein [Streptomyces xinghaiensis]